MSAGTRDTIGEKYHVVPVLFLFMLQTLSQINNLMIVSSNFLRIAFKLAGNETTFSNSHTPLGVFLVSSRSSEIKAVYMLQHSLQCRQLVKR